MKAEVVVGAPGDLARAFAELFTAEARPAIAARGRFSCALPGGSVAETFFPALAAAPVAWESVDFFWGDERAVPPEDPGSNFGLAKRLLLDRVGARPANIHRIAGEESDLDAAARAYEDDLVRTLGRPARLDLVVLGLGPEGHVCSLFPGHRLLAERGRLVAPIYDSPKPPPTRITFTLPVLGEARTVCIAGFGASKAEAIRAAVEDPASRLPVALAARAAARVFVFVDAGAAACPS
ncbi:MAG TPA: 6-phosphogluconolactonase, partial [Thermoanaerobaculia bacterium]|nr:6-phosphogluconolactonase [Thermoanaerobaculia bacterium]